MRTVHDAMGPMQVPEDALYGASTARAVENFPIARRPLPPAMIHAFGHLKAACAAANKDLGKLPPQMADAIIASADEVAQGKHDAHFPVDLYQTGSGTSTNMNANEVIATLANQRLAQAASTNPEAADVNPSATSSDTAPAQSSHAAADLHPRLRVHPNDHVNMGQSSNDTFPTAMHIAGALATKRLLASLEKLQAALAEKAAAWDSIVKVGRTHTMDATPIRVGQVFAGYAQQAAFAQLRAGYALSGMQQNLPIGGTAVGTGINTHPLFAQHVCRILQDRLNIPFAESPCHPEAQAAMDCFVQAHASFKTIAVSLSKIANDIRLLGSGPRCGIGELILPAIQPGSSIMPGKVNPVICESVMQVCCRVIGNDATITTAGLGGVGSIFELNVAMPVMIDAFLESVTLLTNVTHVFVDKCLVGLKVDEARCAELLEQSLMMVTPLAPVIGYDAAAKLAKQAHAQGKTIRHLCSELNILPPDQLDALLDPDRMTRPDA